MPGTRTASTNIKLEVSSTITNTLSSGQTASSNQGQTFLTGTLATGISASQANRCWDSRSRAISSAATEDIDLYDYAGEDIGGGAGRDGVGQLLVIEEIVTLIIKQTGGTGRLEIMPSRPANDATWIPALTVANGGALKSGGVFMMHQPNTDAFDIADASSHMIRLGANGGDVTYDILVLGRHDDDESSSSSSSSVSSSSSSASSSSSSSASSVSSSSSSVSSLSSSTLSSLSSSSLSSTSAG